MVDLGLRLVDVEKWKLQPEWCDFTGDFDSGDGNITDAEKEYLRSGQRVELNAFTSQEFVDFVEEKLLAAGIKEKLSTKVLAKAYRRARLIARVTEIVDDEKKARKKRPMCSTCPRDFGQSYASGAEGQP